MYGIGKSPNVEAGQPFVYEGSIWRGAPESMFFKVVQIDGDSDTPVNIALGTIVKEGELDGVYTPITEEDIIGAPATSTVELDETPPEESTGEDTLTLPGPRLAIISESESRALTEPTNVLCGFKGEVDEARIFVGETAFTALTETQQLCLTRQLAVWGINPIHVEQA